MPDMPIKPDDEKALTVQFRAALNKRAEGQPRGWAAKLARDADLPIATLSHIITGRRMATMLLCRPGSSSITRMLARCVAA